MSARDKRVSLMNEVLQSVRMIKYLAFEKVSTVAVPLPLETDGMVIAVRGEDLGHS